MKIAVDPVIVDIVRCLHLLCFAAGMGGALFADYRAITFFKRNMRAEEFKTLLKLHGFISVALVGLWLSGALLIYWLTQFELANFSPKLWVKVICVLLLTLNALVIGLFVLPIFRSSKGLRLSMHPLETQWLMLTTGTLSVICWFSAMILGGAASVKTLPWEAFAPWVLIAIVTLFVAPFALMIVLHGRNFRPLLRSGTSMTKAEPPNFLTPAE